MYKRKFVIDRKIKPLVDALNSIGYIRTISSCQGHFDREDYEDYHANVIFEVKKEDKHKVEGLADIILGETADTFYEGIVHVMNRYYRVPGDKELRDNWEIDIIPFKDYGSDEKTKRIRTDNAIKKVTEIVKKYSRNYKLSKN